MRFIGTLNFVRYMKRTSLALGFVIRMFRPENESDYFLTPRIRETAPDGHNDEQNFEDAMEVGRPDTRKNYLNWMIQ